MYNFDPKLTSEEGTYKFQVIGNVKEPPNAPKTILNVELIVFPCRVETVAQDNSWSYGAYNLQIVRNETLGLNDDNSENVTFAEFVQYPSCNYTIDYSYYRLPGVITRANYESSLTSIVGS